MTADKNPAREDGFLYNAHRVLPVSFSAGGLPTLFLSGILLRAAEKYGFSRQRFLQLRNPFQEHGAPMESLAEPGAEGWTTPPLAATARGCRAAPLPPPG